MSRRIIHVTPEKFAYEEKLNSLLDKYNKILVVTLDHVQSQQVHEVRKELMGKAVMLVGKKTLQKKIVERRAQRDGASDNDKLFALKTQEMSLLANNTCLLFTNDDPAMIIEILENHRVQAPAKVGSIAPVDVIVPAGNTGMEPTHTSFFQAVNIATKITKGTVEIISDKKVLTKGDRVDNSVAALLLKLKIYPFFYQITIAALWDRGIVFTKEDLQISNSDIEKSIIDGVNKLSSVSLAAGIPTSTSVPLVIGECFRNLVSAAIATNYTFNEFGADKTITDAREGKLAAAAPAAAPAATKKAAPKVVEKEKEEEEEGDFDLGGLF